MPKIHPTAWVAPGAFVRGDVTIDEQANIWYNAVLRGDQESITVGKATSVQDNCVLHGDAGCNVVVGQYVTVGHGAVLHGCTVEDNCLIGMNAVVLDHAVIGAGSIVGALFGGCPNTTYGESVGCIAITGNASVSTIAIAAVYCVLLSFFDPFVCFVNSIPTCIVGGVCIALYGFIAVSGLKMIQPVDLNDHRNLFVVAAILVCGIGGLTLNFGSVQISAIATGLIVGILVNVIFNRRNADKKAE